MIKRLRKKFILISIAAVTSVMILLCAGVNIVNLIRITSDLNKTTDIILQNRGTMPEPEESRSPEQNGFRPGMRADEKRFEKEAPFQTRFFVINCDKNGSVTDYNLDKIAAVEDEDIDGYAAAALRHGEGYGYVSGYRFKVEKQSDGGFTAVFLDCHKETDSIRNLAAVSAAVTVICIGLICFIIVLFSGRAMKPVIESDIRQKQFITDAGHELKTPITVINTCLSVLEMEVGKQKWIDKAVSQTEKLRNLVNSLVTLSKSDEEHAPVKNRFDISGVLSETVGSFSDLAEKKPVRSDIEEGMDFCGDEFSVRQLVSILLDNALRYAPEGSDITFSAKKHKKGVLIEVSNRCENIDEEELPRLFDRFYRADKARSAESGGFGLGLSIARGICEKHRGYIKAGLSTPEEITFTAYLGSL